MKIPTLSVFASFALLGMTLGMGSYGYGSYGGYEASYVPVLAGAGHGAGGFGQGGFLLVLFLIFFLLFSNNNTTTTGTTTTVVG